MMKILKKGKVVGEAKPVKSYRNENVLEFRCPLCKQLRTHEGIIRQQLEKKIMKIFKYALGVVDEQVIEMPIGANILSLQTQGGIPHLWAEVDDSRDMESRHIDIFGTGHSIKAGFRRDFLGTFQIHDGALVFHVYERL